MFSRKYLKILQSRVDEPKAFIQIVTGPRQAGKTTLVEQLLEDIKIPYHYVSADAVGAVSTEWINQNWEIARLKYKASGAPSGLLVIDEIQKINNWSEDVKKQWDLDKRNKINLKVILLGSSALLIQKGLSESLTGRFELITIPHWSYSEMNEAFGYTPEEFLWFGAYPGSASLIKNENRWKSYLLDSIIETSISKDVLSLTNVHKPALLKNLFELACIYSGQILSYNKILGQLSDAGNTTTLKHYQDLLEKIWFISGLNKFSKSDVIIKSSVPKWIIFNTAFMSVYSGMNFKEAKKNSEFWGRLAESAVGAYLINSCVTNNWRLYYWRDNNNEVDFVLESGRKICSIEVKLGKINTHKGIEVFNNKYKPVKSLLISKESLTWQEFLKFNLNELF